MTTPGRTLLFGAIVLGVMLVGVLVIPELLYVTLTGNVLLLLLCWWEGRLLAQNPVTVQREERKRLQLGREGNIVFRIENRGKRSVFVHLRQLLPESFIADTNELDEFVAPDEAIRVALNVTPHARGRVVVPPAELSLRFRSGFAQRKSRVAGKSTISVYPDLHPVAKYENMRRHRALSQFGIHQLRLVGQGREFEELKQYSPDDAYRDINWKATARRRIPMTNIYQAERSQDVLLCIECGRMMGNPVGTGTALDCAIDASIMLAHVATRQSDRVGLMQFTESVDLFLKPKAGSKATQRIVESLVDTKSEPVFPSYGAFVEVLRLSHKRRSMIFLFTDLNDPQLAADLADVLPLVSRRHVVVVVSLRDPLLKRSAEGPARTREDVFNVLAARKLVSERDARMSELRKGGVHVLEADAGGLTMDVINRYLEIKTRQLI